jgi:hypothetical protein
MRKFRVSGPFAFRGNEPGSTFEADPKSTQIRSAVDRGAITEETAKSASSKDKSGSAGTKEA